MNYFYHLKHVAVVLLGLCSGIFVSSAAVVRTRMGLIIGSTTMTRGGRKVNAYQGIPYASPPLNHLRFQDPVPVKHFVGIFQATRDGSECVQRGNLDLTQPLKVSGDEDCLKLSIYTPQVDNSNYKKLPVMVFIYGGGWVTGSNHRNLYGPEYLLDADVILVVINYRLDIFGFFSSGDQLAPGNFGLKDQVLALKWINENIEYFGGDPEQVTIFGESVGGVSVDSLFYSDLAKGLFRRGISISGTVDMPVAHLPVAKVSAATRRLASVVGCPSTPSSALLTCMQSIPAKQLIEKQTQVAPEGYPPFLVMSWIPVYDYNISRYPFFSSDPRKMPNRPTYPWINGATTFDGSYFVCHLYSFPNFLTRLKANPRQYLPELLYLSSYLPEESVPTVTERIVDFYFGSEPINQTSLLYLFTDAFFFIPAVRMSLEHGGPVHHYQYAYPLPQTWNYRYGPPGVVNRRPGHSDILLNLFQSSQLFERTDNATDIQVSERLVDLFTSFAITGNPSSGKSEVTWDTVGTEQNFNYLYLGREFVQKQNPNPNRVAFWRSLQAEFPTLY